MRGVDGGDSDGNREIMGRLSREILRIRVTRNPKQMWQEILNIYSATSLVRPKLEELIPEKNSLEKSNFGLTRLVALYTIQLQCWGAKNASVPLVTAQRPRPF